MLTLRLPRSRQDEMLEPARRELVVGGTGRGSRALPRTSSMPHFEAPLTIAQCVLLSLVRRVERCRLTSSAIRTTRPARRNLTCSKSRVGAIIARPDLTSCGHGGRQIGHRDRGEVVQWRTPESSRSLPRVRGRSYVALPEAARSVLHLTSTFRDRGVGRPSVTARGFIASPVPGGARGTTGAASLPALGCTAAPRPDLFGPRVDLLSELRRTLPARFVIDGPLGVGGQGSVYKGSVDGAAAA